MKQYSFIQSNFLEESFFSKVAGITSLGLALSAPIKLPADYAIKNCGGYRSVPIAILYKALHDPLVSEKTKLQIKKAFDEGIKTGLGNEGLFAKELGTQFQKSLQQKPSLSIFSKNARTVIDN